MAQQQEEKTVFSRQNSGSQDERIASQVVSSLGRPKELQAVVVRRLWGRCFRVNVYVGHDRLSARITNSYFLQADESGVIGDISPPITRQY